MTNPTSNFGWQMPTNTDLVTDLPADFEVFGQAVDTSMAELKGGTTGQILSKTTNADMDFTWIANDQGDITGVTATTPLTGGGTSGAIAIGIQDATTSVKGSVQLSDSTSTTSSVLASTPTATKSAYDLADAAIAKSTLTTAGDIVYRNATVPVRLGIGTAGQVLKVNSGATAPEWGSAAGGSFNTSLATVATDQTTTSTSYVDLATAGPAVTVTTGTKALVSIKASMANGAALTGQMMGVAVSGATTVAASDTYGTGYKYIGGPTNFQPVMAATFLITGLTAGSNTFTAKYRSITGDTIYFKERMISVVDLGS